MDIKLTKDADYMICALYQEYANKLKNKVSKASAKNTGSSERIRKELMSEWSFEDVDETCRELSRAGLLNCMFADDVTYASALEDAAIIYMENRFMGKLESLADAMAKIKAAIPFL